MQAHARAGILAGLVLVAGCQPAPGSTATPPSTGATQPAEPGDYLEVYESLEQAIAAGSDTEDQRQQALEQVRAIPDDDSAAYAFVRAAITGRVAELRGVKAGKLVTEAERWAKTSIDRDPAYRDRAASRMIGSLWVMAPPRLLEHGDSEEGLTLLESLVVENPDVPENALRVAEAYVFLGDPDPAVPFLCHVRAKRDALRADDRALYDRLVEEVVDGQELMCEDAG